MYSHMIKFDHFEFHIRTGMVLKNHWYPVDIAGSGICVEKCPNETSYDPSNFICKDEKDILNLPGCIDETTGQISADPDSLILCGGCMYQLSTFDLPVLYYCVLDQPVEISGYINSLANEIGFSDETIDVGNYAYDVLIRFAQNLIIYWKVIVAIGVGGSALLGIFFLFMLRVPGFLPCSIWTSILATPCILGFGGYYCRAVASDWNDQPGKYSDGTVRGIQAISYACWVMCSLCCLAIIYLRRRIQISLGIAKTAARAVMDVPATMIYPLIQLAGFLGLLGLWIPSILLLTTTGEPSETTTEFYGFQMSYMAIQYSTETAYSFWYFLFIFFWTSEFILAMGEITLALCFSKWYFSTDKRNLDGVSLSSAAYMTICKHFGTAAFGSLIIGFVQFIRFFLLRIQQKLTRSGAGNSISDVAFGCCQCFIFILERWLKYLNKNAYIQTALFSYSYCRGSRDAYFLINRHSHLMGVCGLVSDAALFMGKLFVVVGCSITSFGLSEQNFTENSFSAICVIVGTGILAYFVIDIFSNVLEMAMDTILICFLVDDEMYGTQGSRYVPDELDKFIKSIDRNE